MFPRTLPLSLFPNRDPWHLFGIADNLRNSKYLRRLAYISGRSHPPFAAAGSPSPTGGHQWVALAAQVLPSAAQLVMRFPLIDYCREQSVATKLILHSHLSSTFAITFPMRWRLAPFRRHRPFSILRRSPLLNGSAYYRLSSLLETVHNLPNSKYCHLLNYTA